MSGVNFLGCNNKSFRCARSFVAQLEGQKFGKAFGTETPVSPKCFVLRELAQSNFEGFRDKFIPRSENYLKLKCWACYWFDMISFVVESRR